MHDYNMKALPQSYTYSEVVRNIGLNQVAYCYYGKKNMDAIIFRKKNGSLLLFYSLTQQGRTHDDFELWCLIDEIPNGIIRQNALSRWFEIFNTYDGYLDLATYSFRI